MQASHTVIFLFGRKSLVDIPRLNNMKCWVGFGTRFRLLHTSVILRDLSRENIMILISLLRSCSRIMDRVNRLLSLFARHFLPTYDMFLNQTVLDDKSGYVNIFLSEEWRLVFYLQYFALWVEDFAVCVSHHWFITNTFLSIDWYSVFSAHR